MKRIGRGRPLRFVAAVGLGWVCVRLALTWPSTLPGPARSTAGPPPAMAVAEPRIAPIHRHGGTAMVVPARYRRAGGGAKLPDGTSSAPRIGADPPPPLSQTEGAGLVSTTSEAAAVPAVLRPPSRSDPRRWTGSAWLVLRPGQGIGAAPAAGQLGGSQYGARLVRTLDRQGRLAVFARVAGPLRGPGAEAALGLEWQPGAAPLRFAIEQRVGLDGARGGPGAGAVVGVDRAVAGFRLEAYGQAGAILRARFEPYADGAARLTGSVAAGRVATLRLGDGSWGAAQRGVQRLDVGPTLVASVPLGAAPVRIALDWRQRVAGRARPGSGIALTLGSDF